MLVDGYFVGTLLKASRLKRAYRNETDEPHLEYFRDLAVKFSMFGPGGTLDQPLLY